MTNPRPLLKYLASATALGATLSACTVGPNYVRPSAPTSVAFKEAPNPQNGWSPAQPMDAIQKGAWWSAFNDPVLDSLEKRVVINNQTVAGAEAVYREAQALTAADRASFFPTVSATGSGTRTGGGGGRGASTGLVTTGTSTGVVTGTGTGTTTTTTTGAIVSNASITTYNAGLSASWAPDLFGRIRRQVESDVAAAQADAAELANTTLLAQAQLAVAYVNVRILDEEKRLFDQTVADYKRSLQITENQYKAGVAARGDVITAQTQLITAQAQDADLGVQRAQNEHAIALLIGVPPAELTIAPVPLNSVVPVAPTGVPSTLLQRRPDIAQAERAVKSSNALIGVQVAAYYPDITLSGSYGFAATNLGHLFASSASAWSYGASLSETLLDFGARRARVQQAKAARDQSVAQYRETVLTAFQGVEDQLAALRILEGEATLRDQALTSAKQATQIALNEYRAGTQPYTTVVTAQATQLSAAQSVLAVLQARQTASVTLIEDLGGGWTNADLPKR
jgi:NodT family efflux transporter outer membrane factor (OMF) lipoprotein